MSAIASPRRFNLVASLILLAVFLAMGSIASADTITYNLVPYHSADKFNSAVHDTLTGTITVSSSSSVFGTWRYSSATPSDMTIAYDVTLSNDAGPYLHEMVTHSVPTLEDANWIGGSGVTFDANGIYLATGANWGWLEDDL